MANLWSSRTKVGSSDILQTTNNALEWSDEVSTPVNDEIEARKSNGEHQFFYEPMHLIGRFLRDYASDWTIFTRSANHKNFNSRKNALAQLKSRSRLLYYASATFLYYASGASPSKVRTLPPCYICLCIHNTTCYCISLKLNIIVYIILIDSVSICIKTFTILSYGSSSTCHCFIITDLSLTALALPFFSCMLVPTPLTSTFSWINFLLKLRT